MHIEVDHEGRFRPENPNRDEKKSQSESQKSQLDPNWDPNWEPTKSQLETDSLGWASDRICGGWNCIPWPAGDSGKYKVSCV